MEFHWLIELLAGHDSVHAVDGLYQGYAAASKTSLAVQGLTCTSVPLLIT